jgi:hypothetical protein
MRHCFYHIGDKGTASVEAVRMGLKIIFDIHDQKQDGKIYRINRNKSRIPVEVRMNTKQHIVPHCFYKHVLIAVNSMDEFHDIIRQVFDLGDFSDKRTENDDSVSSVFMELSRLSTTSYATRMMKSGS